ncbi:MAG: hypothetical protein ACKVOH_01875 [Chlamydiales bacterium]
MKALLYYFLLLPSLVFALPAGNPCEPSLFCSGLFDCDNPCGQYCESEFSFRAGYYGDYVFDRALRIDRSNAQSTMREVQINTNAFLADFNLWNRFDIYALFGVSKIHLETPSGAFLIDTLGAPYVNETLTLGTESNFSWGAGVRASLVQCCGFCFGLDGKYFYTNPSINFVTVTTASTGYPSGSSFKFHEWQVDFGTTYSFCVGPYWTLLPYASLNWSNARATMDNAIQNLTFTDLVYILQLYDLKQQKAWGYALGITLLGCDYFTVTFEGRFASQTAFSFNTQLRF